MKHNVNRPGGAASETAALPDWLPVYPGARRSPKGKIAWSFQPTAEFVSGDPIRRVYEYYRSAVRGAGATITSEGLMQSGKPPKDFSAHIKALRGDDGIEIRIGEVIRFSSGLCPKGEEVLCGADGRSRLASRSVTLAEVFRFVVRERHLPLGSRELVGDSDRAR